MTEENTMYVEFDYVNYPCAGKDGKDIDSISLNFPQHLGTGSNTLTKVILENVTGNLTEARVIINDLIVETIKIDQWTGYHDLYSSPNCVVPFSFTVSPIGGLPLTTKLSTHIELVFSEIQPLNKLRILIAWKHVNHHAMLVNNLQWNQSKL